MPLFNSQHQNDRGILWRGIAATAMVELLVLFALAFAVVRYVEWSSATNFAEFMSGQSLPPTSPQDSFPALIGVSDSLPSKDALAGFSESWGAYDWRPRCGDQGSSRANPSTRLGYLANQLTGSGRRGTISVGVKVYTASPRWL
jgi:hypothetical protein